MDEENVTPTPVIETSAPLSVPKAIIINGIIIGASIIIAAAFVMHGPFKQATGTATTPSAGQPQPVAANIKDVKLSGEPFIGNPKAPVTVAYWSDYQCPYCKKFETTSFQNVLKDYVASGKVTIVFKDYAFLGPDSTTAALYERAVWDLYPTQFLSWREAMYNAQDDENSGFGNEASVVKLTATVSGIDAAKVQHQVATKKDDYQKMIDADRAEGLNFGIEGTPSFITGKQLIPGFIPYATFADALNSQLK